jgi:PKHD-type hydroxylase
MLKYYIQSIIIIIINFLEMSSKYFIQEQRNNVNHLNYYYFTSAFTIDEINKIKEIGDKLPKSVAAVGGGDEHQVSDYRKSEVSWIPDNKENEWLYKKIADYAIIANKEMWNFDIWGYQDSLQYTRYYGDGGHYDWHVDLGPNLSNRKLSVVLQLSEPSEYEGGDLEINPGGNILTVPRGLGIICFFPSFLLHRVTPLTSGNRTTLVTWLCGANLR